MYMYAFSQRTNFFFFFFVTESEKSFFLFEQCEPSKGIGVKNPVSTVALDHVCVLVLRMHVQRCMCACVCQKKCMRKKRCACMLQEKLAAQQYENIVHFAESVKHCSHHGAKPCFLPSCAMYAYKDIREVLLYVGMDHIHQAWEWWYDGGRVPFFGKAVCILCSIFVLTHSKGSAFALLVVVVVVDFIYSR